MCLVVALFSVYDVQPWDQNEHLQIVCCLWSAADGEFEVWAVHVLVSNKHVSVFRHGLCARPYAAGLPISYTVLGVVQHVQEVLAT